MGRASHVNNYTVACGLFFKYFSAEEGDDLTTGRRPVRPVILGVLVQPAAPRRHAVAHHLLERTLREAGAAVEACAAVQRLLGRLQLLGPLCDGLLELALELVHLSQDLLGLRGVHTEVAQQTLAAVLQLLHERLRLREGVVHSAQLLVDVLLEQHLRLHLRTLLHRVRLLLRIGDHLAQAAALLHNRSNGALEAVRLQHIEALKVQRLLVVLRHVGDEERQQRLRAVRRLRVEDCSERLHLEAGGVSKALPFVHLVAQLQHPLQQRLEVLRVEHGRDARLLPRHLACEQRRVLVQRQQVADYLQLLLPALRRRQRQEARVREQQVFGLRLLQRLDLVLRRRQRRQQGDELVAVDALRRRAEGHEDRLQRLGCDCLHVQRLAHLRHGNLDVRPALVAHNRLLLLRLVVLHLLRARHVRKLVVEVVERDRDLPRLAQVLPHRARHVRVHADRLPVQRLRLRLLHRHRSDGRPRNTSRRRRRRRRRRRSRRDHHRTPTGRRRR
eukprot:Rhum_TRINITY_DN14226_c8_g2::Rhum_TRINITY_DN14226_c8_g2_i1::g.75880::m.75880